MDKLVSVIIPVYNSERYIEDCIVALLNQSYSQTELIFIDDGSSDASISILQRYGGDYEKITILQQSHLGVSEARNYGLSISRGYYVTFCDSDDIPEKNWIEELVRLLDDNQDVGMACCAYLRFSEHQKENCISETQLTYSFERKSLYCQVVGNDKFGGYLWNKLFISSIVKENQICFQRDISILEDELFVLEYSKNINKAMYIDKYLYGYRFNLLGALSQPINENKLTEIQSRKKICAFFDPVNDEMAYNIALNHLKKCFAITFKKVIFSKLKNKKYWLCCIVKENLNLQNSNFKRNKSWKLKEILYLFILNIVTYASKVSKLTKC